MVDKDFPILSDEHFFDFQVPSIDFNGCVATGGNLSVGMLLSAYYQGVFPWPDDPDELIPWFYLTPRCVLFPIDVVVSKSMRKFLAKTNLEFKIDYNFKEVMTLCGSSREEGTWISDEMVDAYCDLNEKGYAHSFEVYFEGELVGGLYGLAVGKSFCGESMFAKKSNCSKAALIFLCETLLEKGFKYIDCQQITEHLLSMGAISIEADAFNALLEENSDCDLVSQSWKNKPVSAQSFVLLK